MVSNQIVNSGNKKKAEAMEDQILAEFEIPVEDLYLTEKRTKVSKNCIADAELEDLTSKDIQDFTTSSLNG